MCARRHFQCLNLGIQGIGVLWAVETGALVVAQNSGAVGLQVVPIDCCAGANRRTRYPTNSTPEIEAQGVQWRPRRRRKVRVVARGGSNAFVRTRIRRSEERPLFSFLRLFFFLSCHAQGRPPVAARAFAHPLDPRNALPTWHHAHHRALTAPPPSDLDWTRLKHTIASRIGSTFLTASF